MHINYLKVIFLLLFSVLRLQAQISVLPTVTHLTSTSTPSAGAITLTVSGGTSPYSYTWTPGPVYTKDISNKTAQTYTVKVKDNSASTVSYTYNIGYKADWDQTQGCVFRNDTLLSNSGSAWSQAVTKNTLAASTNGWFEYILKDMSHIKAIGFADSLSPILNTYADIDYGFYYDGSTSTLYRIVSGSLTGATTNVPQGAALKVERSGTSIKFLVNGVVTQTLTNASAATKAWKVKGMLYNYISGTNFINVGCSFATKGNVTFKNYSAIIPYITHTSSLSATNGSIKVKPLFGGTYTYTWQPGSVASATLNTKAAGAYTLTADDASHNKTPLIYNIGYKCDWDQLDKAELKNDTLLVKNTGYYGQAVTKNTLAANTDGWFEYVLRGMNQLKFIGFVDSLSSRLYEFSDIDYGFYYVGTSNYLYVMIGGSSSLVSGQIAEGSVLRVERVGSTINFKVNGAIVQSVVSAADAAKAWKIKTLINAYNNGSMINVGCSFYQKGNATFKNYLRLSPTIVHTSSLSATDGSIKVKASQAGSTYTYTWQPGSVASATLSTKAAGAYSLTAADALGNKTPYTYNIGYKCDWDKAYLGLSRNDSLIGVNGCYAISKNTLAANTDGWVEYIFKNPDESKIFGFTDSISPLTPAMEDVDYGFTYDGGVNKIAYLIYKGNLAGGTYVNEGDVLRIEKTGNTFYYKINGQVVGSYTSAADAAKAWKVKGFTYNTGTLVNLGCSFYQKGNTVFPNYTRLNPTIVHNSFNGSNDGSVSVKSLMSGTYTYTWQPVALASATLTGKPAGTYSVTVEDAIHTKNTLSYNVGYKANWDQMNGCVAKHDTLETTSAYMWGRALSKNVLPANTDGWFEYVFKDLNTIKIVGFVDSMSTDPQDIYDIDYGFNYDAVNQYLYTFCNGSFGFAVAPPLEGSVLRVERVADTIMLKINGVVVTRIVDPINARKPWRIKGIVHSWANTRLVNVGCSFPCTLSASPIITNYTDESNKGQINLNLSGGTPPYNIAWNGVKLPDNRNYYMDLDSAMGGSPVDTVILYSKLDSLRKAQALQNIPSAIYNNSIFDSQGNALKVTSLVGNTFSWITSGVSTTTCTIPQATAPDFLVTYGKGQQINKTASGTTLSYAVSDCILTPGQREVYAEFKIMSNDDVMAIGFKTADTLNTDSVNNMIQNTMLRFTGSESPSHTMKVYYNSTQVYSRDYSSGDVIGILLDPVNGTIVYYRNFVPVYTQTAVPGSFFAKQLQLKVLLKTPSAILKNIIITGPALPGRGINGTVKDVTCGSLNSGSISFNGYSLMFHEQLCNYTAAGPNGYSSSGSLTGSNALTGLSAGVYTITIPTYFPGTGGPCSGAASFPLVQTFSVGYMPDWINQAPFGATNVNTIDRSFNITASQPSPYTWLGGTSSDNSLNSIDDGWAEFMPLLATTSPVSFTNKALAFGLNAQDLSTLPADIDHGFYVTSNIPLLPYGLGGGSATSVGPYAVSMFSSGNIGNIFYTSPTDVLKIKKIALSGGVAMKMEYYKNAVLMGTSATYPSLDMIADVSVNQKNLFISKPRISFGCDTRTPYYFVLKKVMDAGYYHSFRKSIYFTFEEEYFDPAQVLTYSIVTDKNVAVTSVPALVEVIGDNRFTINLSGVSGLTQGQFYRIAITNKKNEVFYARFKY